MWLWGITPGPTSRAEVPVYSRWRPSVRGKSWDRTEGHVGGGMWGGRGDSGPRVFQRTGAGATPSAETWLRGKVRSVEVVAEGREGLGGRGGPLLPPVPSEQVLHLWLEVLCSSLPTVEKWYQPWSFLRSPGWVQIKCELR